MVIGFYPGINPNLVFNRILDISRFAFLVNDPAILQKNKLRLKFLKSKITGSKRLGPVTLRGFTVKNIHFVPIEVCQWTDLNSTRR